MNTPSARPALTARLVVLATALLGIAQACWGVGIGRDASASAAVLAPLTVLAAIALARVPRLETRLAVVLAALAQLLLTALAVTIGLPGEERSPIGASEVVAVVLSLAVLVLVEIDRRARQRHADG